MYDLALTLIKLTYLCLFTPILPFQERGYSGLDPVLEAPDSPSGADYPELRDSLLDLPAGPCERMCILLFLLLLPMNCTGSSVPHRENVELRLGVAGGDGVMLGWRRGRRGLLLSRRQGRCWGRVSVVRRWRTPLSGEVTVHLGSQGVAVAVGI